jgi:hypothetical protein
VTPAFFIDSLWDYAGRLVGPSAPLQLRKLLEAAILRHDTPSQLVAVGYAEHSAMHDSSCRFIALEDRGSPSSVVCLLIIREFDAFDSIVETIRLAKLNSFNDFRNSRYISEVINCAYILCIRYRKLESPPPIYLS